MTLSGKALFNLSQTGSTHIKPQSTHTAVGTVMTEYEEYLRSNHWRELKAKSAVLWGSKCLVCGDVMRIERHHVFYRENLCDGKPSEVIPLCHVCHDAAHVNGANKNGQPKDREALKRLVDRLFYQIVRYRKLSTERIRLSHETFWKTFDYCVGGDIPKKWNKFGKRHPRKKKMAKDGLIKKQRKTRDRELKKIAKAARHAKRLVRELERKQERQRFHMLRLEAVDVDYQYNGRILGD